MGQGRFPAGWRGLAPYRPLLALVLVSSAASFAALGVLSLFAHDDIGVSDTAVTVYFVVVAVAGMAVMLVTGHRSDRGRARPVLIAASLAWLAAGYWLLAGVRTYPAMLAVGVVFFSAVGIPGAQLLAHARDLVARGAGPDAAIAVIATVRVVLSVGSFLGFAAGGLGLAYFGARPVFRLTAGVLVACLALSWYVLRGAGAPTGAGRHAGAPAGGRPDRVREQAQDRAGDRARARSARRLLVLLALVMVLFNSGRVMQLAQLPILMRVSLHAPLELVGLALAVPPLCELVLMPAMAWAAHRFGRGRVFLVGGAASVAYYAGLVVVATPGQLLLLQVGYAVFGAATIMVGIDLAQRLLASRAGLATSVYLSHENVAVVHGSAVATVSVAALGHQAGFAVPALLCALALALAVVLFARHPDRFDLRRRRPRAEIRPDRSPWDGTVHDRQGGGGVLQDRVADRAEQQPGEAAPSA